MVVDPAGDVFVADTGNHQIVEVDAYGTASVLAMSGFMPGTTAPGRRSDLHVQVKGAGRVLNQHGHTGQAYN